MPAFFSRKRFILVALLLGTDVFPALAADNAAPAAPVSSEPLQPKHVDWSFEGSFGVYDRASLQRGFQVYKEVCSTCHALSHIAFRNLGPGGVGFSPAEVAAIAAGYKVLAEPHQQGKTGDASGAPLMRAATPADYFPPPFPNEQAMRAAMNGALPPDLSLIVTARAGHSDYVYSIITGFGQTPPANEKMARGMQYNPYYPRSSDRHAAALDRRRCYLRRWHYGDRRSGSARRRDISRLGGQSQDGRSQERHLQRDTLSFPLHRAALFFFPPHLAPMALRQGCAIACGPFQLKD